MQINPDFIASAYTIKSYDTGKVTIFKPISLQEAKNAYNQGVAPTLNTQELNKSAILMNNQLVDNWAPQDPKSISQSDFQKILDLQPELVILGTGEHLHFPDAKDMLLLQQQGIGVEVMGTAAACRTYNFLISDGRNVAAALFMI